LLEIRHCRSTDVQGLSLLRDTLTKLVLIESVESCSEVLAECLADDTEPLPWKQLQFLSLASNELPVMDDSLALLPNVEILDLSKNNISSIQHTQDCTSLQYLNLAFNRIDSLVGVHTVLGNLTTLVLRSNRIVNIGDLCKLYSLEKLDLADNLIASTVEVSTLSDLPCLEAIWLSGNPISVMPDYRTRMMHIFFDQIKHTITEFLIDNEAVSSKEQAAVEKAKASEQFAPREEFAVSTTRSSSQQKVTQQVSPVTATAATAHTAAAAAAAASVADDDTKHTASKSTRKANKQHSTTNFANYNESPVPLTPASGLSQSIRRTQAQVKNRGRRRRKRQKPRAARVARIDKTIEEAEAATAAALADHDANKSESNDGSGPITPHSKQDPKWGSITDFKTQIEAIHKEGGEKWLTILTEFENSIAVDSSDSAHASSTGKSARHIRKSRKKKARKKKSRKNHADDDSTSDASSHTRDIDTNQPVADLSVLLADELNMSTASQVAGAPMEADQDQLIEELLNSYECMSTIVSCGKLLRHPGVSQVPEDNLRILSINAHTFRELDVHQGSKLIERPLTDIANFTLLNLTLHLEWKCPYYVANYAGTGTDAGMPDLLPPTDETPTAIRHQLSCAYNLEDEESVQEIMTVLRAHVNVASHTAASGVQETGSASTSVGSSSSVSQPPTFAHSQAPTISSSSPALDDEEVEARRHDAEIAARIAQFSCGTDELKQDAGSSSTPTLMFDRASIDSPRTIRARSGAGTSSLTLALQSQSATNDWQVHDAEEAHVLNRISVDNGLDYTGDNNGDGHNKTHDAAVDASDTHDDNHDYDDDEDDDSDDDNDDEVLGVSASSLSIRQYLDHSSDADFAEAQQRIVNASIREFIDELTDGTQRSSCRFHRVIDMLSTGDMIPGYLAARNKAMHLEDSKSSDLTHPKKSKPISIDDCNSDSTDDTSDMSSASQPPSRVPSRMASASPLLPHAVDSPEHEVILVVTMTHLLCLKPKPALFELIEQAHSENEHPSRTMDDSSLARRRGASGIARSSSSRTRRSTVSNDKASVPISASVPRDSFAPGRLNRSNSARNQRNSTSSKHTSRSTRGTGTLSRQRSATSSLSSSPGHGSSRRPPPPMLRANTVTKGSMINPRRRKVSAFFEIVCQKPIQSINTAVIALFLQFVQVDFDDDTRLLLMARDKELTHQIITHLTAAKQDLGQSLSVIAQDLSAIQRIQNEALGGETANIRLYALLFRDESATPHSDPVDPATMAVDGRALNMTPVSLLLTDDRLFLCHENFLETECKQSRYIVVAMERASSLQDVTIECSPTVTSARRNQPGVLELCFGHRHLFKKEDAAKRRSWKLMSWSQSMLERIHKELRSRLGVTTSSMSLRVGSSLS
jgi:Leucine-rich repeat (LRR) protein